MRRISATVAFSAALGTLAVACDQNLTVGGTTGSGGSQAASSAAAGPEYVDADATPSPENAAGCPAKAPYELTGCSGEGDICAYWWKTEEGTQAYVECACREDVGATLKFDCYAGVSGLVACDTVQPANGSPCFGHVGTTCPFPTITECKCEEGADPVWACSTRDPAAGLQPPPTTVDGDKPIKDLSAAERTAWCTWYDSTRLPPGSPQPPESPLDADGWTTNTGCAFGHGFVCDATLAQIPISYCEGNLGLSSCAAPVRELTDCILTIQSRLNAPTCWPPEHGCARYLEKPGCLGTIVSGLNDGAGGSPATGCTLEVK